MTALRILLAACFVSLWTSCGSAEGGGDRPRVAFITNCVADFWVHGEVGAKAAGEEFDVKVEVVMPDGSIPDQKNKLEDCLAKQLDGIAISPLSPPDQEKLLSMACEQTRLITHDSDAPNSGRLCYVGMDNYRAGRMCGELVRQALPDGGTIAIFIGNLEQENSVGRQQGVIDAILGRSADPSRQDDPNAVLTEGKYTVIGTWTDQADQMRAKTNVEDVLTKNPDVSCLVGLFGYNPPAILEALKVQDKLGQVKVVAFDEDATTLQGIEDGTVAGTIVQDPYRYGYESVRILAGLSRGQTLEELGVPADGFVNIPARQIGQAELADFRAEIARNLGK